MLPSIAHLMVNQHTTNIHPKTGIAYGCVMTHHIDCELFNEIYNMVADNIWDNIVKENEDKNIDELSDMAEHTEISGEFEYPLNLRIDGYEGVIKGELFMLGHSYHLMITESPLTRFVSPCSPCIVNVGDLSTGDISSDVGVECYALPISMMNF